MLYRIIYIFLVLFPFLVVLSPMYTLTDLRMEVLDYNRTVLTDVVYNFGKINRTTSAFNISVNLLEDVLDEKTMVDSTFLKLYGLEYKQTGTEIRMNLCHFFKKNIFGMRDSVAKAGNFNGCSFPKGVYHLENFIIYTDNFPRYIPYGSYKVLIDIYRPDGADIIKMQWFATIQKLIQH